ncbi:hypothetical protein Tco_1124399 [Tanacetum coccineum]|uniref:Uncharacterized protein n=1 Tax=Tanacetum coccineum TaxID=301880 RepID=A0ABQ5J6D4_9ASTR
MLMYCSIVSTIVFASSSSEYSWSENRLKSGDLNSSRLNVLKCLQDDQNSRSGSNSIPDDRYAVSNGSAYGLEVGSIRRIQGIGYGVLEFLGVGTTFDIFQNIHILYLQYGVLTSSGYGVLIFFPLWSLVSAGTDTPYLP